jgi:hypothetical protein
MIAVARQVIKPANSEGELWVGIRFQRTASAPITNLDFYSRFYVAWNFLSMLRDAAVVESTARGTNRSNSWD